MRKIALLFAVLLGATQLMAQRPTATLEQVNEFVKTSTLYVVIDDNPMSDYSPQMKAAMQQNWTLTPYQFIKAEEMESKLTDPKNAFLTPVVMTFGEDKDSVQYMFLSLLIGGEYESANDLPEICTFPLAYNMDDELVMTYKLPTIVAFFNSHVGNMQNDSKLLKDRRFARYSKLHKSIQGKTIYLVDKEQHYNFNSPEKIAKVNPIANVKFVTQNELEQVLKAKSSNDFFMHMVYPVDEELVGEGRCYTILMSANGELYYFAYHKITATNHCFMTEKDWKTLSVFSK